MTVVFTLYSIMQLDTTHRPVHEGGRCRGWGVGDVRNLLAGRIISATMCCFFFLPETSLTPAIFVSNRHFRKKWASGKPSSQTSGYGLKTVNFLFGSCASCMNAIYLFIIYLFLITGFRFSNFFQTYHMLKQTKTVQNC